MPVEMKSLPPIVAAIAIVLLLLGSYVGAYLWMGQYEDVRPYPQVGQYHEVKQVDIFRYYYHAWAEAAFMPAGWIESKLRGVEVRVRYMSPRELEDR